MFDLIILSLTFFCLLIASIQDWKTREVPDYLSYFLIAAALCFRLLWAASSSDLSVLIWLPISFGIFTTFSYLMYKGGQWGGGDVKLMIGLSIALSSFNNDAFFPYFFDYFVNVLIIGSIYGIVMMVYLGVKNWGKLKKELNKFDLVFITVLVIVVLIIGYVFKNNLAILFMAILLTMSVGLLRYLKLIEKNCMQAAVPVKNLTEGDWLIKDIKVGKTVIKAKPIGLEEDDLKKLRKLNALGRIEKVQIKIGIPFVPAFFFAFIATLLFGNIIFKLLSSIV